LGERFSLCYYPIEVIAMSKSFEPIPNFAGQKAGERFREAINHQLKALFDRVQKLEEEIAALHKTKPAKEPRPD
jgi:hypothetical protein